MFFLEVATRENYLPGLNGSSNHAHRPNTTCKETVTKPIYLTNCVTV